MLCKHGEFMEKNTIVSNFVWKYIERCGYQGTLAVVNIILARILSPEYFGELAIINIIVILGQIFVQTGLSTALIREKEVDDYDYSNMILASMVMSFLIYIILFFVAPVMASFYSMPALTTEIRIMGLVLLPGAINAVQNSKVVREALYKKLCVASVGSAIISGLIGIVAAYRGSGTYSLIIQQLFFRILFCISLLPITRLKLRKPRLDQKFVAMYRFGWKLMISSFLNQLYNQIQTLVVGKKYDSSTLGAYNQGYQYPYLIIANVNTSLQTVILPELSKNCDNKQAIGQSMKKANILSSYIICPLLIGLAFVSNNFIRGILTDKWMIALPYIALFCVLHLFIPLSTINLQGYNAINRSDIYLKNEVVKKILGVVFLVASLIFFNTPIAVAVSLVITGPVSVIVDSFRSGKEFGYSSGQQFKDLSLNIGISGLMGCVICLLNFIDIHPIIVLILQVVVGITIYILISKLFKAPGYLLVRSYIDRFKSKRNG